MPLFEAFANQHIAIGLPEQNGESIATFVGKNKKIARERIALECCVDNRGEGVVTFACINGLDGDEDACAVAECQHGVTAVMKRVIWAGSASMGSLTTMPLGKPTSAIGVDAVIVTGTKRCVAMGASAG